MILGITGGIGAGKSLVCELFKGLGIPVYNSDERAKALMLEDARLADQIITNFGSESYKDGLLNRAFLAKTVFSDKSKLEILNGLVHPAVGRDFQNWQKEAFKIAPYIIKEAAILIESGAYKSVDVVAVVTAPQKVRIQRVMSRDGIDQQAVEKRMTHQMSEEERLSYADFVVDNDGKTPLLQQIVQIHEHLIQNL